MSTVKHYVNEVGLNIVLDCGMNISVATVAQIEVAFPNGVKKQWNAAVWTLYGNPNYILYTTVANDLIQAGVYRVQAYVQQITGGNVVWQALGETASFTIYERFQ